MQWEFSQSINQQTFLDIKTQHIHEEEQAREYTRLCFVIHYSNLNREYKYCPLKTCYNVFLTKYIS